MLRQVDLGNYSWHFHTKKIIGVFALHGHIRLCLGYNLAI